jgi:hypothetical protein
VTTHMLRRVLFVIGLQAVVSFGNGNAEAAELFDLPKNRVWNQQVFAVNLFGERRNHIACKLAKGVAHQLVFFLEHRSARVAFTFADFAADRCQVVARKRRVAKLDHLGDIDGFAQDAAVEPDLVEPRCEAMSQILNRFATETRANASSSGCSLGDLRALCP